MNRISEDILMHYGVGKLDGAPGRGSGRFELGSGENPNQHSGDFLSRVDKLKKEGLSETEIAKAMGLSTTEYRAEKALAKNEKRSAEADRARELQAEGYNPTEIARIMGYTSESSVRNLLSEDTEAKRNQSIMIANYIKDQVDEKGMIDVGVGVERQLGCSKERLNQALHILEQEGYPLYGGRVPQVTNAGKQTTIKVICPPGTEHKEIYNYGEVHPLMNYISSDGSGTSRKAFEYPKSMDSSRLQICYAEDGGKDKDGVVEIRRGVDDLSLGNSHYAQVRILVDDDHYIKGMAMYSDDLPDGVDVRFNTNKSKSVDKMDVLKEITDDPDNPFGSLIKEHGGQSYYIDSNGEEQLSLINKTREEGEWGTWENSLPSQFLSKQSMQLIKKQLNLAEADKQAEYEEICSLTNPTVKKVLLKSFADDCDSAAIHLDAAALPRQKYQVILPLTTIKDNEIYAPNYEDGETVALIRYPHGGTFEIPILTVNNKLPEGKKVLGNTPIDAVGINTTVAGRLSGADFDGDTVMVIPCNSEKSKVKINSTDPNTDPAFKELQGFEPKIVYAAEETKKDADGNTHYYRNGVEYKTLNKGSVQNEMGRISNLITDMTLKGASNDEIVRAVKHSMVIIDANKHHLDYKASEADNNIAALKKKYQAHTDDEKYGGASTLISRAKSQTSVDRRQGTPTINPDGSLSYKTADNIEYVDPKTGKTKRRKQQSTQMAEVSDAHLLSSGTPQEEAYADYANKMKALANEARKEYLSTGKIKSSASAKETYKDEVDSLNTSLNIALTNAPKERAAQLIANSVVTAKKQENPSMTKAETKKAAQVALTQARQSVGASRTPIEISDKEWEAIQAGAISESQLLQILNNTDIEAIKERAMPRESSELSATQINKIKSMEASGYTIEQIAEAMGKSTSTIWKYLN